MSVTRVAKNYGFTIIELLIAIVVIGILAAMTLVAFNGMQYRAEDTKTVTAVSAWAKSLKLYKIDNGNYPSVDSCLGGSNTYTEQHNGVCWGSASGSWIVKPAFTAEMNKYVGSMYPEPSNKTIQDGTSQFRGAMYYVPGGNLAMVEMRVSLFGSECPSISGLDKAYYYQARGVGKTCRYRLPQ